MLDFPANANPGDLYPSPPFPGAPQWRYVGDGVWITVSLLDQIPEDAPSNGQAFGRMNGDWTRVLPLSNGNANVPGNLSASGTLAVGGQATFGGGASRFDAGGNLFVGSPSAERASHFYGNVVLSSNSALHIGGPNDTLLMSHVLQWHDQWRFEWQPGTGDLRYSRPGAVWMWWVANSNTINNQLAAFAGNGAYINLSEPRYKCDITDETAHGLATVAKLKPKRFRREVLGKKGGWEIGFNSPDVADVFEDACAETIGPDGEDARGIRDTALIAALVNAVNELSAKVAALERKAAP